MFTDFPRYTPPKPAQVRRLTLTLEHVAPGPRDVSLDSLTEPPAPSQTLTYTIALADAAGQPLPEAAAGDLPPHLTRAEAENGKA